MATKKKQYTNPFMKVKVSEDAISLYNRALVLNRIAQFATKCLAQPSRVLDVHGFVEAEFLFKCDDVHTFGKRTQDSFSRITRKDVCHEKDRSRHDEQRDQGKPYALQNKFSHRIRIDDRIGNSPLYNNDLCLFTKTNS